MHRPGPEWERLAPRHASRLLMRRQPWVSKARQEHDLLCQELRDRGVEVLYLTALLQDVLQYQPARTEAVALAVADAGLGDELRHQLRGHLDDLSPAQLAEVLIAGLTPAELRSGHGVVYELLDRHEYVLDPLPNLMFSRDASFWIGDQVAVASLAAADRQRESGLATLIYRHHPWFTGTKWLYEASFEHVDGGDVLLLSPGVVAIGVGQRTTPACAERLSRRLFDSGLAHTVVAVPVRQFGGASLDTLCAILDSDAVLMQPGVAYTLTAHTISPRDDGMRVSRPRPFLEAAAEAMGAGRLRVVDSGLDAQWGAAENAADGGNILTIAPRVVISHERNLEANARLEQAGIEVIRVPSSELSSPRGGPRCLTCAISRDPAPEAAQAAEAAPPARRETVSGGRMTPPSARSATAIPAGPLPAEPVPADPARRDEPVPVGVARLVAPARPAPGPPAHPEHPERGSSEEDDQCDQRQPEECLDDRGGQEDHHDGRDDQQQRPSHTSTVRRHLRRRTSRPRASRPSRGKASRRPRNQARSRPWRPRLARLSARHLAYRRKPG